MCWSLFGMLCVLNIFFNSVSCYNVTGWYYQKMPSNAFKTRQNRLISFSDDGDVQLDLDFNVPFLTLPIRKSLSMAKTSLVSLNIGSVLIAGTIVFGAAVIIPVVLAFFNKKGFIPAHSPLNYVMRNTQRSEDSNVWRYLTMLDNTLLENHIDVTSCSQRVLCLAVKNSSQNVSQGKGSSVEKIVDGLASNKWLQDYLSNSMLKEAIEYGLGGRNCSLIYGNCKINPENIYHYARKILGNFNTG